MSPWALGSAVAGWASTLLVVAAALCGVALRRIWKRSPLIRRMRPHYVVGYAALALALVHVFYAMGAMRGVNATSIRFAVAALAVLGLQTFVGASLQDPGAYRGVLRTWHMTAFAASVLLVAVHVIANGGSVL